MSQTPKVTVIRASQAVDRNLLVPGCIVFRWTEPASGDRLRSPLPCHEEQGVVTGPKEASTVVCRLCSTAYILELLDDNDGGYTAHFTVVDHPVLLSRGRPRVRG